MIKKNPKLLMILGGFCLLLIAGMFWANSHQTSNAINSTSKKPTKSVFDVASGDTNNEVLRTVLAGQKKLEIQNKKLVEENNKLRQERVLDMKSMVSAASKDLKGRIQNVRSEIKNEMLNQDKNITSLKKKLNNSGGSGKYEVSSSSGTEKVSRGNVIGDVVDLSSSFNSNKKNKLENQQERPPILPTDSDKTMGNPSNHNKKQIPYYTIPANSTLNDVVLMSSIIAEVPISSKLVAPAFPFKAIIGKDDLFAANGMSLPTDIAGIVLEGYSVGNMTMSCARPYVTKALFVFNDGHFEVFPHKVQDNGTEIYPNDVLGYMSDQYGNTCITGQYISDSPRVLANLVGLSTASGVGDAIAQAQTTTMTSATQSSTVISGNMGKYAMGLGIGQASKQVLDWYMSRVSDVFDAVYIPASKDHQPTRLVFHVSKTIPIDLDKNGRTLRYENNNESSSINRSFD